MNTYCKIFFSLPLPLNLHIESFAIFTSYFTSLQTNISIELFERFFISQQFSNDNYTNCENDNVDDSMFIYFLMIFLNLNVLKTNKTVSKEPYFRIYKKIKFLNSMKFSGNINGCQRIHR